MTTAKPITSDLDVGGGKTVRYVTTKFPFEEALELQAETLILVGDTASGLGSGIGGVVSNLGRAILERGGAKFVYRILAQTAREGVKLNAPERVQEAYGDNLAEMIIALEWVIRTNFGSAFGDGVRQVVRERILAPAMAMLATEQLDASWMRPTSTGASTPSPQS